MGFHTKKHPPAPSAELSLLNLGLLSESKAFVELGPRPAHRHDVASPAEAGKSVLA